MRNLYRLILTTLALFCPALALGQVAGNFQSIAISGAGRPLSNINVAVCSGLSTTAAAVSGNVATLTMSANPISTGFQLSGTITVYQFSGADAYFNGTFTITNLNSTQIQFALTHANASASSNGNVVQQGGSTGSPCLPLTTLYTDSTGSNAASNPFQTDGLGNVSFWAAPQTYEMQYYGGGLTTTMKAVVVSCVPGNSNCGITAGGNIAFSGNNTHTGTELFASLDLGTVLGSPRFTKSAASCCTGFAQVNTGVYAQSSLVTDGSFVQNLNDGFLQLRDNGHSIFIQAGGPRADGGLLADSTLTIGDINQHGATPQSGGILDVKYADVFSGHIPVFGTTSLDTYVIDSQVTALGGSLTLGTFARLVVWPNGGNSVSLTAVAASGNRVGTLPDASGNVPFLPTVTTTETGSGAVVKATSPTITTPTIATGLSQGSGFKHQRFGGVLAGTCPTAAAIGAACTSGNLNWPTAFADNSYTVVCTLNGSMTGQPHIVSTTYQAAGAGITLTIAADTAVAANVAAAGFVDCNATHD